MSLSINTESDSHNYVIYALSITHLLTTIIVMLTSNPARI